MAFTALIFTALTSTASRRNIVPNVLGVALAAPLWLGLTAVGPVSAAPIALDSLVLNGTATNPDPTTLRLTTATGGTSTAFVPTPFAVGPGLAFHAMFEFDVDGTADGFTFMLHNDPAGVNAIGPGGIGLGYMGITPSVAVEFDFWRNAEVDSSDNHVDVLVNGSVNGVLEVAAPVDINRSESNFAWIDYDGRNLTVFLAETGVNPGTAVLSRAIGIGGLLGSQAFIGFSGSTGGYSAQQDILSFDLEVTLATVPLPATLPLIAAGLGGLALGARRRQDPAA